MGGFLVASSKLVMFTAILMVVTISVAVLPLVFSSASSSTVTYKVRDDDDAGWSSEPPLMGGSVSNSYNGNGWSSSSSKAFHVGDTIRFEYDPHKYQTVVQVTPTAYDLCDYTSPLAVFTTGNDSITFNNTGHYYFIVGPGGGCVQEQMLHIYVHEVPILASAAVSSPSSSLAAAVTASSLPPPPPPSSDDGFALYMWLMVMMMMILGALVIHLCYEFCKPASRVFLM